jgi:hypothetical protein
MGLFCLILSSASPAGVCANDFQSWQWINFDLHRNDEWRFYLYTDNRVGEDLSEGFDSYIQVISPRFKWHATPGLDLGLGYARLEIDPLTGVEDFWQHRTEFEINPRFRRGAWSFHSRNRLEQRWKNGRGKPLSRLRHRLQAKYSLEDGPFLHLYANNEFFFDLEKETFAENRLVPLGIGLRLSEVTTLDLFYMVQSLRLSTGWQHSHIAGTFFQISF